MSSTLVAYSHSELVALAKRLLDRMNCKVVITDPFRSVGPFGEQPDAIGWKNGLSWLIECKVSRADFHADKLKRFRAEPEKGMGDWRFYLCPEGVITVADLPAGWGLLWVVNGRIKKIHGFPANAVAWTARPFRPNRDAENCMLVSALRRLALRGHFDQIYDNPFMKTEAQELGTCAESQTERNACHG
jgi:hypothetical protein